MKPHFHRIPLSKSLVTLASVQLYVNGNPTSFTAHEYKEAVQVIRINAFRVGCCISDSNDNSGGIHRCFNGIIAHIRFWKVQRSLLEIKYNLDAFFRTHSGLKFCDISNERTFEYKDKVYVCLWHLTEGKGVVGFANVST